MIKKYLSIILAVCMLATMAVFTGAVKTRAAETTVTFNFPDMNLGDTQNVTDPLTKDGVTITFSKAGGSTVPVYYENGTGIRVYKDNTIKVEAGKNITKVVFEFTQENGGFSANTGTYETPTWTGSASSVTFTKTEAKHHRIKSMAVTLSDEGGSTDPGTNPGTDPGTEPGNDTLAILEALYGLEAGASLEGTYTLTGVVTKVVTPFNTQFNNITVNMVCAGYDQYPVQCYRLEGDGADQLDVNDTITVTGKLKRYNNTYEFDQGCHLDSYVKGTPPQSDPLPTTTEEILKALYALEKGDYLKGTYTLTGKITEVVTEFSSEYNNVTVVMVCEGYDQYPVTCYRLKGEGADVIGVNDTITVTGSLKRYNDTYEFDQGCNLDSYTKGEAPATGGTEPTPTPTTTEEILKALYALEKGKALEGTYTLTGKVTEVVTEYSEEYQNVTVNMVCEGYDQYPVQCFRLAGDGADIIGVNDTITVTGTLKRYNDTYEFDKGCHLDSYTKAAAPGEDPTGDPDPTALTTPEEILNAAYALESGGNLGDTEYTLTGVITKINDAYSDRYKNITVTMVVNNITDKPIQCFRLAGDGADKIMPGDTITVKGKIKNYNGTVEFDQGCQLLSYTQSGQAVELPETPEEILAALYALEAGDALPGTYTLTGKITEIQTEFNPQYNNISVVIAVEGHDDQPVLCYRLEGQGADSLRVGDVIEVKGTLKNYNGTREFAAGCTILSINGQRPAPSTGDAVSAMVFAGVIVVALCAAFIARRKREF
ncbi:MAG: LPXTG cell wall anchor domain-containing protein [Clostridia bacterium]|nr:LPXTG cell wall anchor domain-containing protein [Clostridia bacterium]